MEKVYEKAKEKLKTIGKCMENDRKIKQTKENKTKGEYKLWKGYGTCKEMKNKHG